MANQTVVNTVVENAGSYFSKVAVAVVILLGGFALGILVQKVLFKVLKEIELNKILSKVGIASDIEKGLSLIASYVIYLITIVLFLDNLGIKSIVLYLILGGFLTLLILTFLVGLKDVIPNFVAWFILQRKNKLKEGHHIDIKEISGTIERFGYLETEIKTNSGDILYVPNSLFLKSKVKVKN